MKNILVLSSLLFCLTCCGVAQNTDNKSGDEEIPIPSPDPTPTPTPDPDPTPTPSEYKIVNSRNADAIDISIASLVNKTASEKKLYRIKGIVEQNTYTSKGVFDISDDTGWIEVYGASATKSCISGSTNNYAFNWTDCNYYSLNNLIRAGDEVVLEGVFTLYENYKKTPEFQGYVVEYKNNNIKLPELKYTASETYSGTYYNGTDLSATGSTLYKNLQTLMFNTHKTWTTYNGLYSAYSKTGESNGTNYTCFYTGNSLSKNKTNREHVWAQSLSVAYPGSKETLYGETYAGSDVHHLRPCTANVNSTRSSKLFGQLYGKKSNSFATKYTTNLKYTETIWEVPDQIKGDVARIVLYVFMHYNSDFSTVTRSGTGKLALQCIMSPTNDGDALKLLKYWNALDPVDSVEMKRNEGGYQTQGNRNPFIDHPSLVDKL